MSKSRKSRPNDADTRTPRDSKSGHRAKSATNARKAQRNAKRAAQGRA